VREVDAQELHLHVATQPDAGTAKGKEMHSMVEGTCRSSLDSNYMPYTREIEAVEAVGCYGRMSV